MLGKVVLDVTQGPLQGRTFAFDSHDTFLFGRSRDCHARLAREDQSASRHHFLLEINPPHARLRDLGSLNGTYVNGEKHGGRSRGETPEEGARRRYPETDLHDGDLIKVGKTHMVVRVEQPAEAAPPTRTCQGCGAALSPAGESLCDACSGKEATDPLALLMDEMAAKAQRDDLPAPVDVAGYRVSRRIGIGGMGVVYLAHDPHGRAVALKVLMAKVAVGEAARKYFAREIDVIRELRHPRIVGLVAHGSSGSGFYFAMEYCPGGSVADLLAREGGRLPLGVALPLVLQALEGLAHAHAKGFVHRDIKPGNLLLDEPEGGEARLADFGLAKNLELAGLSGITVTGSSAGSIPFMPREQITNFKYVGAATDVWGTGATLYHMLTGLYPYDFPPDRDPLSVILNDDPVPIRVHAPAVPEPLAAVIDRATHKDAEARYADAHELLAALREARGR